MTAERLPTEKISEISAALLAEPVRSEVVDDPRHQDGHGDGEHDGRDDPWRPSPRQFHGDRSTPAARQLRGLVPGSTLRRLLDRDRAPKDAFTRVIASVHRLVEVEGELFAVRVHRAPRNRVEVGCAGGEGYVGNRPIARERVPVAERPTGTGLRDRGEGRVVGHRDEEPLDVHLVAAAVWMVALAIA